MSSSRNPSAPSPDTLSAVFRQCGFALSKRQTEQLWLYHGLLRHHNPILNLTRIHNFNNMVLKLYVDSVLPILFTDLPSPLMDLGSGPGMPGIPLKILMPDLALVLAEGRANRAAFLEEAVNKLGLENTQVWRRTVTAETKADMAGVITRAVEGIDLTLARISGCLRQGGRVFFMKGPECDAEMEKAGGRYAERFALLEDRHYRIGDTRHRRRLVIYERLDAPAHVMARQAGGRHKVHVVTSETNNRYKGLRKLFTGHGLKKSGQAIMSGKRQVTDMLRRQPEKCLAWITSGQSDPPPAECPETMTWLQFSPDLFQNLDVFGTKSPLLVISASRPDPWTPAEGFPRGCSLLVPFQDPENVGAAIRSAVAFGAAQVILLSESAHPFHPKALRASGGAAPFMRLRRGPCLEALPGDLPIICLSSEGTPIGESRFPESFGLLAGIEGGGLPVSMRNKALRIPMEPGVESLNAAVAVAVALYEWRRRQ